MVWRARRLLFLGLLASPSIAVAQSRLTAQPVAGVSDTLPQGLSRIGSSAVAYRPPSPAGTAPGLVVLFHGAGGNAARFITLFQQEADRRGLVLLSVQSTSATWDMVGETVNATGSGRAPAGETGIDARRVDKALITLLAQVRVDPARILAMGFSDGASYALSIGVANDRLFTGIVALAPGMLRKSGGRRTQRIAIAHGRSDPILPFANASGIAKQLSQVGYPVLFTGFAGGHQIHRGSLTASLDFALGR